MTKFTHLHVHSHYSLLDGLPKIDQIIDHIKELGMDSVALTDHGVLYGAVEFYKKAKAKGIKPIIGCEAYVAKGKMEDKRPNIDGKKYHLVLLVKNEQGYKNLVKLMTEAHLRGFYYKPRFDEELLAKHSQGLIGLSACLQGKIPQLILAKNFKEAEDTALKYQKIFGKDSFYLEIQCHPHIPEQKKVNEVIISISKKLNIPLVATNDCHYIKEEDAEAQDILMLINTGADPNNPERITMKADDFSIKSSEKMIKEFEKTPEAVKNTQKIADLCNFKFKLGETKLPSFEVPNNKTADKYLKELCLEGLKKRYDIKPADSKSKIITDRLNYELSVISQTGFASYFLIVQDFVNWAKENRIVTGPGRGSAAGSLVSYLLKITDIDPIKYDLLFERFLNPERISLPDIDMDFTDERRDEVINYIAQKYGRDRVAQIITFGTMAARAVVRDVGRALGYDYSFCDKLAKMIPPGFTLDQTLEKIKEFRAIYESDEKAKTLLDFAKKLEGCARHASTHACGLVISKDSLENIVPLQLSTQNDKTVITQYEMHSVEDLGLLKMDLLGLKNLSIIEKTLNRIYKTRNEKVDIGKIPLDDKKTFKLFQNAETTSVFQLESDGMKRYLKQLKPTELEDIIAMVSLYRPGPIQFIPKYIRGKQGKEKIEYLHPKLKPILEKTYGIMVYQEQVMKIAQELAGFSLGEADILRKAIGKKIKKLLISQKEKFIKGMQKNEIKKEVADKIWLWVEPFARYSFNRSHAASYAMIAYRTAYLKTHYPVEFMAAVLTAEKNDIEKISFLIEECKRMKIEILAPDINESFRNFSVVPEENKIRFGLLAIKNVGHNIVGAIITERKDNGNFKSIADFISRIDSKDLNKKSLESLIKAGAFDLLAERNQLLSNIEKLLEWNREIRKNKTNGQKGLFDKADKTGRNGPSINLPSAAEASEKDKLNWEKELLGLYITSHPLKSVKKIMENGTTSINKIKSDLLQEGPLEKISSDSSYTQGTRDFFVKRIMPGERVKIGGIIAKIKKIITRGGKPMLFVNLEDMTDRIELVVFPSMTEQNQGIFQENKIVFITGKTDIKDGSPKIICDSVEEIIEES